MTRERIVDTTLRLMAEHGYEAVSMRSLAKELNTGPASIYAHVSGRDELDQLVLARITSQLTIPDPDPERWQEQIKQFLRDMLELYRAHPGSARAALGAIPSDTGTLEVVERTLAILLAGGITEQAAAWFIDVSALYVGGLAYEELVWAQREVSAGVTSWDDHEFVDEQFTRVFAALPPDRFPLVTALATVLTTGSPQERFEFGLDLLVGGLEATSKRMKREAGAQRAKTRK